MKIIKKIFLITMIIFCIFSLLEANKVMAGSDGIYYSDDGAGGGTGTVGGLVSAIEGKLPEDGVSKGFRDTISKILGFLQLISGLMAVIIIAITGFNYIVAQTSDVKKEIKDKMAPILIGMVLVFGAASIAQLFLGIAE